MSSPNLDSLYRTVAKKVLTQTLRMKKGEALTVEAWNNGLDFARVAVAEARAMGCNATMTLEDERAYVEGVRRAPKDMVGTMGKNEYALLSGSDAYIFVPGQALGAYSKTLTAAELGDSTRYNTSWYDAAEKAHLRGARMVFGYVGKEMAKMVGRKVDDIVRGHLKAALVDFQAISRDASKIVPRFEEGTEVTVVTGKESLRLTLKGEMEIDDGVVDEQDVEAGRNMTYMPPGWVSRRVDPASANGKVVVSETLTKFGLLPGAELRFKEGLLVEWKSRDKAKLNRLIDGIPEDKRRVTIVGIGLNPRMSYRLGQDRFVRGTIALSGIGFTPVMRSASLSAAGVPLVTKGTPV